MTKGARAGLQHVRFNKPNSVAVAGLCIALGFGVAWDFPRLVVEYGLVDVALIYSIVTLLFVGPLVFSQIRFATDMSPAGPFGFSDTIGSLLGKDRPAVSRCTAALMVFSLLGLVSGYLVLGANMMGLLFKSVFLGFKLADSGLDGGAGVAEPVSALYADLALTDLPLQAGGLLVFALFVLLPWIRFQRHGLARPGLIGLVLIGFLLVLSVRHAWLEGDKEAALAFMFAGEWRSLTIPQIIEVTLHAVFGLSVASGVFCLFGEKRFTAGGLATRTALFAAAHLGLGSLVTFMLLSWTAQGALISGDPFTTIYHALPEALHSIPQGRFYLSCFQVLACLLCWSTAMYLCAPLVVWIATRYKLSHQTGGAIVITAALALAALWSFDDWSMAGLIPFQWLNFLLPATILPLTLVLLTVTILLRRLEDTERSDGYETVYRTGILRFKVLAPGVLLVSLTLGFAIMAAQQTSYRLCWVIDSSSGYCQHDAEIAVIVDQ